MATDNGRRRVRHLRPAADRRERGSRAHDAGSARNDWRDRDGDAGAPGDARSGSARRPPPHHYVLTATGNVYEDVVHARAVADHGGDIVAVIRSTAQSLLDYVPDGPTTEGFGGTFATQANFRIMREALDEWAEANGRYVRLSSFCSGLCMPEIASMRRPRGLRQHGQRRPLRDPLPRHQHGPDADRPAALTDDQRLLRGDDQHRRGQLPADCRRARGRPLGGRLADHQLPAGAGSRVRARHIAIGNAFEIHPRSPTACCWSWRRRS